MKPITLRIKPLSVNKAWQGKRFKTPDYKMYQKAINWLLNDAKPYFDASDKYLSLKIVFGFSNLASDVDNPVKPFQDCLSRFYQFDDKKIRNLNVSAVKVKKHKEFICFNLEQLDDVYNVIHRAGFDVDEIKSLQT